MPDWINYSAGTVWSTASYGQFIDEVFAAQAAREQQMWEEHQQKCAEESRIIDQMIQDEKEREEDKKKHPLFYWKEGIV